MAKVEWLEGMGERETTWTDTVHVQRFVQPLIECFISGQHLVLITDPERGESVFAFDNAGFKDGRSSILAPSPIKENHTKYPPVTVVPLRSHDFTGLGFNICGNMRDGIYVKDVLHRGPASESGRIMPGDRIDSIRVSLKHMVFEDALTILSYASPYEVELSIQSRGCGGSSTLLRTPPPPHKISHPFFRSHSISDLQQISKNSTRRINEQPSSLLSDIGVPADVMKPSTLDSKAKIQIGPERNQNARNFLIGSNHTEECVFHEIELEEVDTSKETSALPQSNVKSILVKGIQNLKEKLHNSLQHQDDSKDDTKSNILNSGNDMYIEEDNGFKTADLNVPEEVERAGVTAKIIRNSPPLENDIQGNEITNDNDDPVAAKRSKRKAPKPPTVLDTNPLDGINEILNHHTSLESGDSDSENGDASGTTIELNSSHITVHHAASQQETAETRKASSLGDLSRYDNENSLTLLERAVSMDLAEECPGGQCNKKRKAPIPPQEEVTPYKEARLDGTLKKSSVWGTLEDVIQSGEEVSTAINAESSESETDLGISGCSTPEKFELFTPASFKFDASSILNDSSLLSVGKKGPGISNIEVSSCNWDISMPSENANEFVAALNGGDETPPELPTSPMPILSSYVTEIQVTSIKSLDSSDVIHLNSTQQLMDHMNTHCKNEESTTYNSGQTPPSPLPSTHSVNAKIKSSNSSGYSKENISDQIFALKASQSVQGRPSQEVVKPARMNVTVTNIKSSTPPSRIPVRAGHRNPGTSLSPSADKRSTVHRNGHATP
uniref:PDZ domain-containing protein n=1 Tax=Rhodnius prolixus TaxID=13249 RepID=T1HR35_RHOPR